MAYYNITVLKLFQHYRFDLLLKIHSLFTQSFGKLKTITEKSQKTKIQKKISNFKFSSVYFP